MKRHYQQPVTSVAAVYLQSRILDVSPGGGPNGVSAIRTSYGTSSEEIWD